MCAVSWSTPRVFTVRTDAVLDRDGSGFITFDELEHTIRQKCKKVEKVMPHTTIKALWCALDKDCSNSLEKSEMGDFLRAGADSLPKAPPPQKKVTKLTSDIERVGMGRALDCTPTSEMIKELKAAGVHLPTAPEVAQLSRKLNTWLQTYRRTVLNQESAPSWFNLYAVLDRDGSGFITYDELQNCVRQELKKPSSVLPTNDIKALWCKLDVRELNKLDKIEMAAFLRLGAVNQKPRPFSAWAAGAKQRSHSTRSSSQLGRAAKLINSAVYGDRLLLLGREAEERHREERRARAAAAQSMSPQAGQAEQRPRVLVDGHAKPSPMQQTHGPTRGACEPLLRGGVREMKQVELELRSYASVRNPLQYEEWKHACNTLFQATLAKADKVARAEIGRASGTPGADSSPRQREQRKQLGAAWPGAGLDGSSDGSLGASPISPTSADASPATRRFQQLGVSGHSNASRASRRPRDPPPFVTSIDKPSGRGLRGNFYETGKAAVFDGRAACDGSLPPPIPPPPLPPPRSPPKAKPIVTRSASAASLPSATARAQSPEEHIAEHPEISLEELFRPFLKPPAFGNPSTFRDSAQRSPRRGSSRSASSAALTPPPPQEYYVHGATEEYRDYSNY